MIPVLSDQFLLIVKATKQKEALVAQSYFFWQGKSIFTVLMDCTHFICGSCYDYSTPTYMNVPMKSISKRALHMACDPSILQSTLERFLCPNDDELVL